MNPDTQDNRQDQQEELQHAAEHETPRKPQSVLIYLVILFAAAFVLLAWTFLMQQRSSSETIAGLRESVSAMESVQSLQEDNDALRAQVEELEKQLEQAEADRKDLQKEVDGLSAQQEGLVRAMDLFWQIDEAYVRGRYSLCRSLIEQMEDTSTGSALKEYLPKESTTDNDRYSPADRYQEICDAVP